MKPEEFNTEELWDYTIIIKSTIVLSIIDNIRSVIIL